MFTPSPVFVAIRFPDCGDLLAVAQAARSQAVIGERRFRVKPGPIGARSGAVYRLWIGWTAEEDCGFRRNAGARRYNSPATTEMNCENPKRRNNAWPRINGMHTRDVEPAVLRHRRLARRRIAAPCAADSELIGACSV